jgi:hypothetical protein
VQGSCEHILEPLVSIKAFGSSSSVSQLAASQRELSSVQSVSYLVGIFLKRLKKKHAAIQTRYIPRKGWWYAIYLAAVSK